MNIWNTLKDNKRHTLKDNLPTIQIEKLRPYKFLNIQLAKEASSLNKKAQGHFVLREKVQGLIEIKINWDWLWCKVCTDKQSEGVASLKKGAEKIDF